MQRSAFFLLFALVLAACTSASRTEGLRGREWRLAWVEAFPSMPAGVTTPTLMFGDDDRISAQTGCNSAGGTYAVSGDGLTIGNVFSTKRACVEEAGNRLEAAYLGALERTRRFRIADGQLELLDDGGAVVARFN
ncbi:MAG TPA: META domain-containing protein [Thermoanaerobaculia bacterium]